MHIAETICGHLTTSKWPQIILIRCPFKKLTGFDCPGCGFQRSLIALIQGDLVKSFSSYPAAIPLLALLITSFINKKYIAEKFPLFKQSLYILTSLLIIVPYIIKIKNYI
jgi:hypothetical protein